MHKRTPGVAFALSIAFSAHGFAQTTPVTTGVSTIPISITAEVGGPPVTRSVSVNVVCTYSVGAHPSPPSCPFFTSYYTNVPWFKMSPIDQPGPPLYGGAGALSAESGTTIVSFTANPAGMSPGVYTTSASLSSATTQATVFPITFTINQPALQGPASFAFSAYTPGGNDSQNMSITVSSGSLIFQVIPIINSGGGWLDVSAHGGTTPAVIQVLIHSQGLAPGTYTGSIVVSSGGARNGLNIPVTLTVKATTINTDTVAAGFTFFKDSRAIESGYVGLPIDLTASHGTLSATVTPTTSWLSGPTNQIATPASIIAAVNPQGLPLGTSMGSLIISAPGAYNSPLTIPVSATVTACTFTPGAIQAPFVGLVSLPVTTNSPVCEWWDTDATSDVSWVSIYPNPFPHRGSDAFVFTADKNPTTSPRVAHLTVAGQAVTFNQPGSIPALKLFPGDEPTFVTTPSGLVSGPHSEQISTDIAGTSLNYTVSFSSSNTVYPTNFALSRAGGLLPTGGNWLTVTPQGAASTPGMITISANPTGLGPGYYRGQYVITTPGQPALTIPIVLNIPYFVFSNRDSIFAHSLGQTGEVITSLSLTDLNGPLSFSTFALVQSGSGSVAADPPAGAIPGTVTLTMDSSPGIPDLTTSTLSITAMLPGGTIVDGGLTIPIIYDSLPGRPLSTPPLNAQCCTITYLSGSTPPPQTFSITSTGGPISCTLFSSSAGGGGPADTSWINVSPTNFTTPATLTLIPGDPSTLVPDSASVRYFFNCTPNNYTLEVDANLSISLGSNVGSALPAQMTFWAETSAGNPPAQTAQISTVNGPLQYNVTVDAGVGYSWLTATPSSGSAPNSISISVNKTGLAPGVYHGTVAMGRYIPLIPVTLYVSGGHLITPSPASAVFTGLVGGSIPTPITVSLNADTTLPFTVAAGSDANWLSVSPPSASAPGSITLSANTAGMLPGNYTGKVSLTSATAGNSPLVIPVTLSLGACVYTLNVTSPLNIAGTSSVGSISVTTSPQCTWTAGSSDTSWLTVNSPSGTVTGSGTVQYVALGNGTVNDRTAILTIAGNFIYVDQAPIFMICHYTLSSSSMSIPAGGTSSTISITSPVSCFWEANTSDSSFVTLSGTNPAQGTGSFSFTVAPNSGAARSATVSIGGQTITINQDGSQSTCTVSLDSTTANIAAAGGSGNVAVTDSCQWSAVSNASWLTVNSVSPTTGNATVNYTAAANSGAARSGTLTIAGETYTVVQPGGGAACAFSLTSPSATVSSSAGSGSVNLTTGAGCSWMAASGDPSWLTVTSAASGTGNKVVTFSYAANAGLVRSATINIGGQNFGVLQNPAAGVQAPGGALQFYSVTPCRLVDTRAGEGKSGGFGPPAIAASTSRDFALLTGGCSIPATAQAYSLNFTAVPDGPLGFLSVWPTGQPYPGVSTLNSIDGSVIANAAIVPAGTAGSITVVAGDPTDLIIDINGYFAPAGASGLDFFPLTPCRIADTRAGEGKAGAFGPPGLAASIARDFPIDTSPCLSGSPQAYSLNMTAVPQGPLGFLSVWPVGLAYPGVSTLNSSDGIALANAAIVPAGTSGDINVVAGNPTDLIIDINGIFATPATGGLQFYAVTPCRAADTRSGEGFTGAFGPPSLAASSTRNFPIQSSQCGIPATAHAYALNMTVVPQGPLGFLSVWPTGSTYPGVSTLNSSAGNIIANAAIVPAGAGGAISVVASNSTDLIIDIVGYFAP